MKVLYLILGPVLIVVAMLIFISPSFTKKMMEWDKKWRRMYGVKTEYLPSAQRWYKVSAFFMLLAGIFAIFAFIYK